MPIETLALLIVIAAGAFASAVLFAAAATGTARPHYFRSPDTAVQAITEKTSRGARRLQPER